MKAFADFSSLDDNAGVPSADDPHVSHVLWRNYLVRCEDDCRVALLRRHVLFDGAHFSSSVEVGLFAMGALQ